jgi:type III secretion protein L
MGLVVLTERPDWQLACDSKVLEPVDVLAIENATQLMQSVELYGTRVLRAALKVYDDRAQEGFKTGEVRAQATVAERLFALEAARASLIDMLRPSLTDLLLDAMGRLARGIPRERLYASALAAIDESWRSARWACMRVHPQNVATAKQALADLATAGHSMTSIGVVGDHAITLEGCRFESDLGFADAGLDAQLQALRNAFSEGLRDWASALSDPVPAQDIGSSDNETVEVAP